MNYILTFFIGAFISAVLTYTIIKDSSQDKYNNLVTQCNQELKKQNDYYNEIIEMDKESCDFYKDQYFSRYQDYSKPSNISKIQEPYKEIKTKHKLETTNTNEFLSNYEKFENLLDENSFDNALEIYATVLADNSKNLYRRLIDKYLFNKYKESNSLGRFYARKALEIEPDYFYFKYILMISEAKSKKYKNTLDLLIELKASYISAKNIEESVNNYYESITSKFYRKAINSEDRNRILSAMDFFNEIQEYEYARKLKNRIFLLNDKDDKKLLAELKKWEKIRQQWKAQDEKDRLSKIFNIQIPLKKVGKHYLVPVRINGGIEFDMMLDTGASYVTVKSDLLKKYSPRLVKRNVSFNTANGTTKKHKYLVDKFSVGEIEFNNFPIFGLNNYHSNYNEGLFGMDFLEKFDWDIDEENKILFLNRK